MARRKRIPSSIDTEFFQNVTPLWRPPSQPPIPEIYNEAVMELAAWAGPDWHSNEKAGFFRIRQVVISSCEAWNDHDWEADASWIDERRNDEKLRKRLRQFPALLSFLIGEGRFVQAKLRFCRIFLASLGIEAPPSLTNADVLKAFDQSARYLGQAMNRGDSLAATFGPLEYGSLPTKLPRPAVAVALCLADRITFFRKDGHSKGTLCNPHAPNLSPDLPWKAISLFASAHVSDPENQLDPANVQTLVEKLAKSVTYVSWTPSNFT